MQLAIDRRGGAHCTLTNLLSRVLIRKHHNIILGQVALTFSLSFVSNKAISSCTYSHVAYYMIGSKLPRVQSLQSEVLGAQKHSTMQCA